MYNPASLGGASRRVAVVRKLKLLLFGLFVSCAPALVCAELNVALLDLERAVFETTQGEKFLERLGDDLKPQREEAENLAKEIRALQEEYRVNEAVMGQRQKLDIEKRIADLTTDLQAIQQKFQRERQVRMNDFAQDMLPKAREVIDNLIEIEGYDMVMMRNAQAQIFYYVNPRHDITRKVTEKLNEVE
jgi:outer membrane protein